jgi:hypothetical protein
VTLILFRVDVTSDVHLLDFNKRILIQNDVVAHPDPSLVGIRDSVSEVKWSGHEAEHS